MSNKPYEKFNEHIYQFVDVRLARATKELTSLVGNNFDVWDCYRNIGMYIEEIAADIIAYTVYKYFNMKGISYYMSTDDDSEPRKYQEIHYSHGKGMYSYFGIPSTADFHSHVPNILGNMWQALRMFQVQDGFKGKGIQEYSLTMNKTGGMFAAWIANVDGHIAYGNMPAEATTHACGVKLGIWGEDSLPPAGTWKPTLTINPRENNDA